LSGDARHGGGHGGANTAPIAWVTPKNVEVRFSTLSVGPAGSWFHDYSNWAMQVRCSINGQSAMDATPFFTQRVKDRSTVNVAWAHSFGVGDADVIECSVDGTYTRTDGALHLGTSSTGPITVSTLRTAQMSGQDANTSYSLTWAATQLP
jgi:hypothetical protein